MKYLYVICLTVFPFSLAIAANSDSSIQQESHWNSQQETTSSQNSATWRQDGNNAEANQQGKTSSQSSATWRQNEQDTSEQQNRDSHKVNKGKETTSGGQKEESEDSNKEDKKKESTGSDKSKKEEEPKPENLLKVGNLAFPPSQQPTPLVSFGQNLIGAKKFQFQFTAIDLQGKKSYKVQLDPALIYGFKDYLGIIIDVPCIARQRMGKQHSSGVGDTTIQMEAAVYTKEHYTYYDQLTIVGNVTIPTGSTKRNPPTGVGANSFFIGTTFSRLGINWDLFTSYGAILNTSSHRTQYGNHYLYQVGVGRRIFSNKEWLFLWMVESTGDYGERDVIQGKVDPNSGGNVIYLTPSLFLSDKDNLIVQLGVGYPIVQHLNGNQKPNYYLLQTKISWTF